MRHYNVWSAEPMTHEQLIKVRPHYEFAYLVNCNNQTTQSAAPEQEIEQHTQGCEYLHFVNPFPLASIPAVGVSIQCCYYIMLPDIASSCSDAGLACPCPHQATPPYRMI